MKCSADINVKPFITKWGAWFHCRIDTKYTPVVRTCWMLFADLKTQ